MDQEYLFLCPSCKKLTIGIGAGENFTDYVKCKLCKKRFTAYYFGDVDNSLINIDSKINVNKKIEKVFMTIKI